MKCKVCKPILVRILLYSSNSDVLDTRVRDIKEKMNVVPIRVWMRTRIMSDNERDDADTPEICCIASFTSCNDYDAVYIGGTSNNGVFATTGIRTPESVC